MSVILLSNLYGFDVVLKAAEVFQPTTSFKYLGVGMMAKSMNAIKLSAAYI